MFVLLGFEVLLGLDLERNCNTSGAGISSLRSGRTLGGGVAKIFLTGKKWFEHGQEIISARAQLQTRARTCSCNNGAGLLCHQHSGFVCCLRAMKRDWIKAASPRLRGWRGLLMLGLVTCMFMGGLAAEPPRRYDIRAWQTDEGLPQNSVTAVVQTPDGYLWAGTRGGLARFDGVRFTLLEDEAVAHLKDAPISALCVTKDGS